MSESDQPFDYKTHEQEAVTSYLKVHGFYQSLASVIGRIISEALKRKGINVHSVQARAKDPASFGKKASQPSASDPNNPKYRDPLNEITDLAGVRVITYFPSTLSEIDEMLKEEFRVFERSDKGATLIEEERFGYQSIHYLVRINSHRAKLPEYEQFGESVTEVQIRTILQHAWAEIEHDINYKSAVVIPNEIRRRFMALAGMLEIADREFQAIQDEDEKLKADARSKVEGGQLQEVEITPDALKAFLDRKIGSDGRISDWSYDWTVRLLKKLGFKTLDQVEKCIDGYDDASLSRLLSGARQGQTSRFEYMLLAGMGDPFIRRHHWGAQDWFEKRYIDHLETLKRKGIQIKNYDPSKEAVTPIHQG